MCLIAGYGSLMPCKVRTGGKDGPHFAGANNSTPDNKHGAWLKLNREVTKRTATTCAVRGCSKNAKVGAHMWQKGEHRPAAMHIVGTCKRHNAVDHNYDGRKTQWLQLKKNTATAEINAPECVFASAGADVIDLS